MIPNMSNYLHGMVRIRIKGAMPEKFINLCIAQQILLWDIVKYDDEFFASMRLTDFFAIRPITRISKVKVRVVSYRGFPFIIKRMKRRKMLVLGAVMCLVLLNIMSVHIWFVDVTGTKQLPVQKIKEIAVNNGLKPGVAKDQIDAKQIEKEIILNIPEIAWVGVTFSGTRAEIEVVEKTVPKQGDKAPADIIASKDGVITEFITLAGKPVVKKGDTVKKGDLLITGVIPAQEYNDSGKPIIDNIPPQLVRANGIVKARVWYESYGEAELLEPNYQRTGKREIAVNINVGGNEIILKDAQPNPDSDFEKEVIYKKLPVWRNSNLVVESEIIIYHEVNTLWSEKTIEEARNEARTKALSAVQSSVPETAHILSRTSQVLDTAEPNLVRVKVSLESVEEIGQSIAISH